MYHLNLGEGVSLMHRKVFFRKSIIRFWCAMILLCLLVPVSLSLGSPQAHAAVKPHIVDSACLNFTWTISNVHTGAVPLGSQLYYEVLLKVHNSCGATLKPGGTWEANGQGVCPETTYLAFSTGGGLPQLAPNATQTLMDSSRGSWCSDFLNGVEVHRNPPVSLFVYANANNVQFVLNNVLFNAVGNANARVW